MSSIVSSIREFICFNQKQTIKYEYFISEHHKKLKNYFQKKEFNNIELQCKYEEFLLKSYEDLIAIFELNKEYIDRIFKDLGKRNPPRITIKTIQMDEVLNIYNSSSLTNFQMNKIVDNTGFYDILYNNKIVFLENNIQNKFKNSSYINPRLDNNQRKKFKKGEIEWKDCWKKNDGYNSLEYYSSTLILPMSIRSDDNDENDIEFYNHFFKNVEQHKDSRTVWGFLCFDDKEINYFMNDDNSDFAEIGYIISDILSLYLMYFYNHVSGSTTIKNIETQLKKSVK